jgi:hypothetical protein
MDGADPRALLVAGLMDRLAELMRTLTEDELAALADGRATLALAPTAIESGTPC